MTVNVLKIYAGGLHSWAILDDVMPKKDEYQTDKGVNSLDDDSLLNDDESIKNFSNIGEN